MKQILTDEVLKKYAKVMINFAPWGGKGVQKGESVLLDVNESGRRFLPFLYEEILKAGAHPMVRLHPEGISRTFYEMASEEQLEYFSKNSLLGKIEDTTHWIRILSEYDPLEMQGVDSEKIMKRLQAGKFYKEALFDKCDRGEAFWTLCRYATEGMAAEANLTLDEYWDQIIKACYLDMDDPIACWQENFNKIEFVIDYLNKLDIDWVHVESQNCDLKVRMGEKRKWLGGSGHNIPSFEVFISPDFRGTEGWIKFDQPLYRYGNLIEGIELKFEGGKVVEASAKKNEKVLKDMIAVEGADMVGEFSLTDKRLSRIDRFMADTLFDENYGGEYGNTHIALGAAYKDSYTGDDFDKLKAEDWKNLGFNESAVHTDIVSTVDRVVTAYLKDGSSEVIYKDGMFTFLD
jgi:aminopeptidase